MFKYIVSVHKPGEEEALFTEILSLEKKPSESGVDDIVHQQTVKFVEQHPTMFQNEEYVFIWVGNLAKYRFDGKYLMNMFRNDHVFYRHQLEKEYEEPRCEGSYESIQPCASDKFVRCISCDNLVPIQQYMYRDQYPAFQLEEHTISGHPIKKTSQA